jgi:23S rRNA (guanosine2251-2'-O)-methyltransferase
MSYHKVKYDKKVAIIFGNENKGVSPLLLQNADFNVQIPKRGNVQSLNVSVSVGIILSEINKQLF